MDQQPMAGAQPLRPPTPDVARAYLTELDAVAERREARIDRRRIARLALVEAAVLAVYVTLVMLGLGAGGGAAATPTMALVAMLLFWLQLSGELKEDCGYQRRAGLRGIVSAIALVVVMIGAMMWGTALAVSGAEIPILLRVLPGVLVAVFLGGTALRELQVAGPAGPARTRSPLAPAARWATATLGLLVAAMVGVVGLDALIVSIFGLVLMIVLLGWWTAMRISDRLPVLGAVWAWPQWTAFALGNIVLSTVVALPWLGVPVPSAFAAASAAAVLALFVIAAFQDGRDER